MPLGQAQPYTIQFANAPDASSSVGEIRIVSQLDADLDPRSFRLGDMQLGDIHDPRARARVGSFQHEFDFTRSKGFILRVTAGIDISSQHGDLAVPGHRPADRRSHPRSDQGPAAAATTRRAPDAASCATPCVPKDGLATGTQIDCARRACSSTTLRRLDTAQLTYTIDGVAPTTTLTAAPVVAGGSDYYGALDAQATTRAAAASRHVTVYVSEDGGDYRSG